MCELRSRVSLGIVVPMYSIISLPVLKTRVKGGLREFTATRPNRGRLGGLDKHENTSPMISTGENNIQYHPSPAAHVCCARLIGAPLSRNEGPEDQKQTNHPNQPWRNFRTAVWSLDRMILQWMKSPNTRAGCKRTSHEWNCRRAGLTKASDPPNRP